MLPHWIIFIISALFAGAAGAAPGDKFDVVRDLASRVGPVVGAALACRDIARPRIQVIVDKFAVVIKEAVPGDAERTDLTQQLDRAVADGRRAVTAGQIDCGSAERQLADLERSIAPAASGGPSPAPSIAAATPAGASTVRGVTDKEIRFGISAPFSGSSKELGRQMKLGIDTAFNRVNDGGGVEGRMLRLIAADDGYEPAKTAETMKQLYEKDQVFGIIGMSERPQRSLQSPTHLNDECCFSARLQERTSCAAIRQTDMYSIIVRATLKRLTPWFTTW